MAAPHSCATQGEVLQYPRMQCISVCSWRWHQIVVDWGWWGVKGTGVKHGKLEPMYQDAAVGQAVWPSMRERGKPNEVVPRMWRALHGKGSGTGSAARPYKVLTGPSLPSLEALYHATLLVSSHSTMSFSNPRSGRVWRVWGRGGRGKSAALAHCATSIA